MSTSKKSILLKCLPHKPLDVQTKQKAACRQKPAATSKQFHTGQQIHLTEALAPAEGEEVAGPIDAEHTHTKLHSSSFLYSYLSTGALEHPP